MTRRGLTNYPDSTLDKVWLLFLSLCVQPAVQAASYAEWDEQARQEQRGSGAAEAALPETDQVTLPAFPGEKVTSGPRPVNYDPGTCVIGLGLNGSWDDIRNFYREAADEQYGFVDLGYMLMLNHRQNDEVTVSVLHDTDVPGFQSAAMVTFVGPNGYRCDAGGA